MSSRVDSQHVKLATQARYYFACAHPADKMHPALPNVEAQLAS